MLGAKDRDQYKLFYDKQGSQGYSNCHLSEGWERITPQVPYYKGKVFEAGCLTPETDIFTDLGLRHINSLKVGDRVLAHTGKFQKITALFKRKYRGKLIEIRPKYSSEILRLTPEHPVYVCTTDKKYSSYKSIITSKPIWVNAENLTMEHILVYPIANFASKLLIEAEKIEYCFGNRGRDFSKISVTPLFMRLVGYYIAEGTSDIAISKHRGRVSFSFNIIEEEYAKDIKSIAKKLFNVPVNIVKIKNRNVCIATLYSVYLAEIFSSLFGHGAKNKKLPYWMLTLPDDYLSELFIGLWRGDGSTESRRFVYTTISSTLAYQIKMILAKLNIIAAVQVGKPKILDSIKSNIVKSRFPRYDVRVGGEGLEKLSMIMHLEHPTLAIRNKTFSFGWIDEQFVYVPIKELKVINGYSGNVFNLEIESDNSYCTKSIAVHNCQTGGVTKIIAKYAEEVVTCELSSSYFETASKNLCGIPNISIIHGFAEDALEQFPDYFDVVCLNEILEHVLDDGLLVAKSFAALKDGGLILFSTPLEGIFPDTIGEHTRQYSIRSILELFEPYHHSLRIEPTDCPIWIVGMAWKKESPKRTFMKNLGVWHI